MNMIANFAMITVIAAVKCFLGSSTKCHFFTIERIVKFSTTLCLKNLSKP